MPSGDVVVKVSTAERLIPVEGATVFIVNRESGRDNILASRSSGRSGLTGPVTVQTPDKALSISPGSDIPFTSIDIRIEHPRYYPHYISGAQIFASTQSIQNAVLIPLAVPTEKITDNVVITPQNL